MTSFDIPVRALGSTSVPITACRKSFLANRNRSQQNQGLPILTALGDILSAREPLGELTLGKLAYHRHAQQLTRDALMFLKGSPMEMESEFNFDPYATTASPTAGGDKITYGLSRWGRRLLVVEKQAMFPDRCVKCNAPARGYRLKRTLHWHHPAIYLLLITCAVPVYYFVATCVQQSRTYNIGLCPAHRKQRTRLLTLSGLAALLACGMLGVSFYTNQPGPFFGGTLLILVSLVVGSLGWRVLSAKKIDQELAWVKGVCPDFLESVKDNAPRGP